MSVKSHRLHKTLASKNLPTNGEGASSSVGPLCHPWARSTNGRLVGQRSLRDLGPPYNHFAPLSLCHFAPSHLAPSVIHDCCVISKLSAAKETAAFVANAGVELAGNVAIVASPTRKTLKSFCRFLYPAVVAQT